MRLMFSRWLLFCVVCQSLLTSAHRPETDQVLLATEISDSDKPSAELAQIIQHEEEAAARSHRKVSTLISDKLTSVGAVLDRYAEVVTQHSLGRAASEYAAAAVERFSDESKGWLLHVTEYWLIIIGLNLLTAVACYRSELDARDEDEKDDEDDTGGPGPKAIMRQGHYDCLSHSETCLYSLLCPTVRWADSVSGAGLLRFWPAFWLFAVLMFLNMLAPGHGQLGVFTGLGMLYYRKALRDRLSLPTGFTDTCCKDCIFILCCPYCAIAQEARAVRRGRLDGVLVGDSVMVPEKDSPEAGES
mmetsp:Transcript_69243/g.129267  ORF Transcript_69243/g.129267 Transcript_69243/m.129267 type:complete len:302 (+) Transcript_69243:87-992(+)